MVKSRAYRSTSVKHVLLDRVLAGREGQATCMGCDISKEEIIAVLRWGAKDFERPWKVRSPGELGLFVGMLQRVGQDRSLVVAVEPTGTYGDAFRQALSDAGLVTHRVSPKASHDYAEIFDGVPSQHDGKDAAIVAELSSLGKSTLWAFQAPSETDREMAYWVDWQQIQQGSLNGWYGRLEGLLTRSWPEASETLPLSSGVLLRCLAEYGGPRALGADREGLSRVLRWGRGHLSQAKAEQLVGEARGTVGVRQSATDVFQLQQYATSALDCRRAIRQAENSLKKLVQDHATIQAQAAAVGVVTACVLWVHLGDPALYDSGAAYRKAMGLNLTEFSSGTWQGRLRISKRGHSQVRRWLYFSALRWIQVEPIKSWYETKKSKKSGQDDDQVMRAIIGVMRKLALALYQVGARGATFDPGLLFPGSAIAQPVA
jgi:transposase